MSKIETPHSRPSDAGEGKFVVVLEIEDYDGPEPEEDSGIYRWVSGVGDTLEIAMADAEKSAIAAGLGHPGRRRRRPPVTSFVSPKGSWSWSGPTGPHEKEGWYKDK